MEFFNKLKSDQIENWNLNIKMKVLVLCSLYIKSYIVHIDTHIISEDYKKKQGRFILYQQ